MDSSESLGAVCAAVAGKVVAAVRALNELTDHDSVWLGGRSATGRLGAQLRMLAAVVGQLGQWLAMASVVSGPLQDAMRAALRACDEIVAEIDGGLRRAAGDGSESAADRQRRRPPWDQETVREYEGMLGNQFQALNLCIQLIAL